MQIMLPDGVHIKLGPIRDAAKMSSRPLFWATPGSRQTGLVNPTNVTSAQIRQRGYTASESLLVPVRHNFWRENSAHEIYLRRSAQPGTQKGETHRLSRAGLFER